MKISLRHCGGRNDDGGRVLVADDLGSGFDDPRVLPEFRYRIPAASRIVPGLGAMALGIARTAIETFSEISGAKALQRSTQMLGVRLESQTERASRLASSMTQAAWRLAEAMVLQNPWRGRSLKPT